MKTSKLWRRVSAMVLIFSMVFGLFSVSGNTIKANAATDKVKLYSADTYYGGYGANRSEIYIQINDNASNKAVYVHYQCYENQPWVDEQASYVMTLSDGSQLWKANTISWAFEYAIKYVGDNQTYWDNNNGNNYTGQDVLGTAPLRVNRLASQSYDNFKVQVTLKNLAYTKVVKVKYTEDNWATYNEAALSYVSSDTSRGTEVWSTTLSLDSSKSSSLQYAVSYQANGQTYWDNNLGSNYNSSFYIYR